MSEICDNCVFAKMEPTMPMNLICIRKSSEYYFGVVEEDDTCDEFSPDSPEPNIPQPTERPEK